jgi:hypothetical protein
MVRNIFSSRWKALEKLLNEVKKIIHTMEEKYGVYY